MSDAGQTDWEELERRRRTLRWAHVATIPIVVAAFFVPPMVMLPLGAVWLVPLLIAVQRVESWRCPRCGKTMFRRGVFHNSFARRCMHCDLPVGKPL